MDDERDRLIGRIGDIQRDLGRIFAQNRQSSPLFDSNLTMRQLKVVMLLAARGSASGQELAHHLGVGLGTVTGLVDRLVGHGLAARREDPHDRRVRRAELTPAGHSLMEHISNAGLDDFRRLLVHLDTQTLHDLCSVMDRIQTVAATLQEEDPPTRKVG